MNSLNCRGRLVSVEEPLVMGILNVTPDSFFDGGQYTDVSVALEQAKKMVQDGARIIDVGGMSSRPGAEIISVQDELDRVIPIIKAIHENVPDVIISIDTVHSEVAKKAIQSGASMINDISGGDVDEHIWQIAAEYSVPYILMHMQGKPQFMQDNPRYEDVCLDILNILKDKVFRLRRSGVKDVIVDPGFGFGKTLEQNYELLNGLASFKILDCPILAGVSRKSMIYKLLNVDPSQALNGTTAVHIIALQKGANILRVHDVKEAAECIKIFRQANA